MWTNGILWPLAPLDTILMAWNTLPIVIVLGVRALVKAVWAILYILTAVTVA